MHARAAPGVDDGDEYERDRVGDLTGATGLTGATAGSCPVAMATLMKASACAAREVFTK